MKDKLKIGWEDSEQPKQTKRKPKAQAAPGNSPTIDNRGYIGGYFRPLGWDTDNRTQRFYFYSKQSNAILSFSTSKFTKQHLTTLAPIEFWDSFEKSELISDYLVTMSNAVGYFDLQDIRGRGAWKETDRIIFHCGGQLISDSIRYPLGSIETDFTYEMRKNIRIPIDEAMNKIESSLLTRILGGLNWGTLSDGKLLAGWLAIAPICGALAWRPHVWITGPRGNGKSWVLEQIINPILGNFSINAQGTAATEAAIRQKLNSDAMPVTIDESEGNDENAARRMQEVIGLARAGSSEKSPAIPKGGKDGKATDYFIRSAFLFVSINPQLVNDSDKRRFTVLELQKHEDGEKFKKVNKQRKEVITADFGQRFIARMIKLLPNILKSIEIFTDAITELTEDRSIGDQYGALFGGWWHTWNDDVVNDKTAKLESAAILDMKGVMDNKEELSDEERCLQAILQQECRIEAENFIGTLTIGELIEKARHYVPTGRPSQAESNDRLKRFGLQVIRENNKDYLLILNTSQYVKNVLSKTPFAVSYPTVLKRVKSAESRKPTRFSAGLVGRCIQIDLDNVL